ncbi:hypothetical protein QNK12_14440 [Neobacillus cucumis]|nr:hypothetical protein QNK12_14440 [Neobacillus cucumis]
MDEFENMMAEFNDWLGDAKNKIKASVQIDPSKLDAFVKIIAELVSIKQKYADKLSELRTVAEEKIVKLEYSKGGETIHRGYYCPSPVLDLIIGGMKRGRLFKKKKPEFGNYSYEYGFDKDGRLLRVKGVNEFTTPERNYNEEYLLYNDYTISGVEFDNTGDIVAVSRCTYENNNIVKYERSVCSLPQYADLYLEEYAYENNLLSEVRTFDVTPRIEIYNEQKYKIELNENGKIVNLIGGFINNGVWEQDYIININPKN